MNTNVNCLDRDALLQMALVQVSAEQAVAIALHLADCAACRDALKALTTNHGRDATTKAWTPPPADSDGTLAWSGPHSTHAADQADTNSPTPRPAAPAKGFPRPFGRYELLGQLGGGGMGIVYKARQQNPNRLVALKMIRDGELAGPEEVRRFLSEAEAAAQLDHPGIVPVFEAGEHAGRHFFSMGYVPGESLEDRLKSGPLPPRQAAELMQAVARAVQYAHERGVIHRDLKPGNILLDADSRPRVTDFGLAKQISDDSGLTATGQAMGTASYMPPEQAQGRWDRVGPAADIYSLGATLYALLTGRPPFQGSSKIETLRQVVEQEPAPPRQLNAGIPQDLETIALKCLEKDPAGRCATAREMSEELSRFLANEPILARRIGRAERAIRWCRRKPVAAALLMVAFLFLGVLAIGGPLVAIREANLRDIANTRATQLGEKTTLLESRTTELKQANSQLEAKSADLAHEVQRANEATEDAGYKLYLSQIARADSQLQVGNLAAAQLALQDIPLDRRGWEYRYLRRRIEGRALKLKSHGKDMGAAIFSPDGNQLAVVSQDMSLWQPTVKLWDTQTGEEIRAMRGEMAGIYCIAFSPDGRRLAGGLSDNTIKLWDVWTGEVLHTLRGHLEAVGSVSFSPDGTRLASSSHDKTVRLWDLRLGEEIFTLHGHTNWVNAVTFSPDGARLASASSDHTIKLWDARTGEEARTLRDSNMFTSVTFSPDGRRLASGSYDRMVKLWDAQTGEPVLTLYPHTNAVHSVCFSPDGTRVASECSGDTVKVRDARTGAEASTLLSTTSRVIGGGFQVFSSLSFSPDGTRLAHLADDHTVNIWDVRLGAAIPTLRGHVGRVSAVTFSPDGTRLASSSHDNTVKLWDVRTLEEVLTFRGHTDFVSAVSFSPDGNQLASASGGHTIKLWDAQTGEEVRTLRADGVLCISFSPDGGQIASGGSTDGTIRLWDARTGEEIHTLRGHQGQVLSVTFRPGGTCLASSYSDGTVKFWDTRTGEEIRPLLAPPGRAFYVSYSPDGGKIAGAGSGSRFSSLWLWDERTGGEALQLRGHVEHVFSITFNPSGSRLASCSSDRTIKLWDTRTGAEVVTLRGHNSEVTSVSFSPDGTRLAGSSDDGTITLWDARTGDDVFMLSGPASSVFASLGFNADGTRLVAKDQSGETHGWEVPSGKSLEAGAVGNVETPSRFATSPDGRLRAQIDFPDSNRIRLELLGSGSTGYDAWAEDAFRRKTLVPKWHAQDADAAELDSNWFAAAFHLRRLIELQPDDLAMKDRLSGVVAELNSPEAQAVTATARSALHEHRSRLLEKSGRVDEALQAISRALEFEPDRAVFHERHGDLLKQKGDFAGALAAYNKALELEPERAGLHQQLGGILAQQGDLAGAIAAYTKALTRSPADFEVTYQRAWLSARLQDWGNALQDFSTVLSQPDRGVHVWGQQAIAQLAAGDRSGYARSCREIRERFARTPNHVDVAAWHSQTCTLHPSGVGDTAELLQAAELAAHSNEQYKILLPAAQYRHGNYDGALATVDQLSENAKSSFWPQFFAAMAHFKLGHVDEARLAFDQGVKFQQALAEPKTSGDWTSPVIAETLRREAAVLLGMEAETPADEKPVGEPPETKAGE